MQTKTVVVFSKREFEHGFMPTKSLEAVEWLRDVIDTIPEEYRATAEIRVESGDDFGSSYAELTISYERPETAEEEKQRKADKAAYLAEERLRLQRQLDMLNKD